MAQSGGKALAWAKRKRSTSNPSTSTDKGKPKGKRGFKPLGTRTLELNQPLKLPLKCKTTKTSIARHPLGWFPVT
ncbi:hypothetical protein V7S43_016121 [Phytophthora oleae]|uniref:Uncharacterized protein n=1 Tax=Phytophthora oleae TaxID=2107226 RepID=A0ABD3F0A1_9STRA